MPTPTYLSDPAPSQGARVPAGSRLQTDAAALSLNGAWRFRLSALDDLRDGMAAPQFDDSGWVPMAVPTHWVPTDDAAHPHELPESTASYLFGDAAQHGLGSHACGLDVWPEFALPPEARTIRLRFDSH